MSLRGIFLEENGEEGELIKMLRGLQYGIFLAKNGTEGAEHFRAEVDKILVFHSYFFRKFLKFHKNDFDVFFFIFDLYFLDHSRKIKKI